MFDQIIILGLLILMVGLFIWGRWRYDAISLGVLSGFFGGKFDQLIKFITTLFMSFPGILLAIAFAAILSPGKLNLIIAI